ncbi:MAG: hypothetical protein O3B37_11820 [Proteobacteria bacterium]|nr:hypothetical protein [Pseudomonadota bacterium]
MIFAVAVGLYSFGASNSPLTSERLAVQQDFIRQHSELQRAEVRARAYWERNPDVRANAFFGEGGAQGIFGAWVHYDRHGRDEGRKWGP